MEKCFARHYATGEAVEIRYSGVIEGVDSLIHPPSQPLPFVAPGWIDIQINGFAGVDYNTPKTTVEQIGQSLDAQARLGVARLFPTLITNSYEEIAGSLRVLAAAREKLPHGAMMDGFHVEGPYISPEDGPRGAHPQRWCRRPDWDEFQRWQDAAQGHIKLMTVSPEWEGTTAFIERVVRTGVVIAIGHTKADSAQIDDAVRAGATMSTHLGNGAHQQITRHPNYIFDQLADDRLAASFIVDGIHLGAAFLKVALRAKGIERSVLITDAVMPAGCEPGFYRLGEVEVELHPPGDRVTVRNHWRLAGAALRMDHGVSNLMKLVGLSLRDAVTMGTVNAARAGRVAGRQRGLAVGERADLVLFEMDPDTKSIAIRRNIVGGSTLFES